MTKRLITSLSFMSAFAGLIYVLFFYAPKQSGVYKAGDRYKGTYDPKSANDTRSKNVRPDTIYVTREQTGDSAALLIAFDKIHKKSVPYLQPASVAGSGYSLYKVTVNSTLDDVTKKYIEHGFTEVYAKKFASSTLKLLKKSALKKVAIFSMTAGAAGVVQEGLVQRLPIWMKVLIAVFIGCLFINLYNYLKEKGVLV